jgi:hypothetical protein
MRIKHYWRTDSSSKRSRRMINLPFSAAGLIIEQEHFVSKIQKPPKTAQVFFLTPPH